MGLFRQQVLDAQVHRLQGEVLLLPRVSHTLLCLGLLCWLALATGFLITNNYSRKEAASGWLEPVAGLVPVYARSEGRLAQLLVSEGEQVEIDQPLAIINGDRILADGQHLEALLLNEYEQQKLAMQRQLLRNESLGELRKSELHTQAETLGRELSWMVQRIVTLEQRAAINKSRKNRHQQLARNGHITSAELDSLTEQELRLLGEIQALTVERLRRQAQLQKLQSQLAQIEHDGANTRDGINLRLSQLSQQIAQLRGNRAYIIKAAVAGIVSTIQLHEGQQARLNTPLLTLLPADSELIAQLLVPVRAAGFLENGQELSVRYDAFPYQKFGTYYARVMRVSDSPLIPGASLNIPLPVREVVYRVTARLDRVAVAAYGETIALKAGMTLSADIQLEQRSLLQWLLEPLQSLGGRLV